MRRIAKVPDKEILDSIAAIVVFQNSVLFVKKKAESKHYPNKWNIITGHIHYDETPKEAAIRELREEIGLEGIVKDVKNPLPSQIYHGTNIYPVLLELVGRSTLNLDGENIKHDWVPKNQIGDYLRRHEYECVPDIGRFLKAVGINYN